MIPPVEVMLASNEMKQPIEFYKDWVIQEKTDGIRALIVKEGSDIQIWGRNQTKQGRANFTQSLPEVVEYFKSYPYDFILDCELMSSDFLTLQTKVRTIKKYIADPNFYIKAFDILKWMTPEYPWMGEDLTPVIQLKRYKLLASFIKTLHDLQPENKKFLRLIVQAPQPITSQDYLNQCLQKVVDKGGEGLIIKNPNAVYQPGKRSKDWIKVLPEFDMDVMFIDAIVGDGKYKHTLGALKAVSLEEYEKGHSVASEFNVGTGFDDKFRHMLWVKQWTGDERLLPLPGKIKYKNLYPSGLPRQPVFKSFNADKM